MKKAVLLILILMLVPTLALAQEGTEVNGQLFDTSDALTKANLTIEVEEPKDVPTHIDDCKQGGWEDFGFDNQGRCVSFVRASENAREHARWPWTPRSVE